MSVLKVPGQSFVLRNRVIVQILQEKPQQIDPHVWIRLAECVCCLPYCGLVAFVGHGVWSLRLSSLLWDEALMISLPIVARGVQCQAFAQMPFALTALRNWTNGFLFLG